ncbi:hypothetical protein [Persicirhabdus sediminis]|nr:hypothetical protein [Persicirhabdus sediminis]
MSEIWAQKKQAAGMAACWRLVFQLAGNRLAGDCLLECGQLAV